MARKPRPKSVRRVPPAGRAPRTQGEWQALLGELEDAARRLDVAVRYDARLAGAGGFCRVYGAPYVFVNSRLPRSEQAWVLAQSLREAAGDALDSLPLRPRTRALFERAAATAASAPRAGGGRPARA